MPDPRALCEVLDEWFAERDNKKGPVREHRAENPTKEIPLSNNDATRPPVQMTQRQVIAVVEVGEMLQISPSSTLQLINLMREAKDLPAFSETL